MKYILTITPISETKENVEKLQHAMEYTNLNNYMVYGHYYRTSFVCYYLTGEYPKHQAQIVICMGKPKMGINKQGFTFIQYTFETTHNEHTVTDTAAAFAHELPLRGAMDFYASLVKVVSLQLDMKK
jgi:hypothetical protein